MALIWQWDKKVGTATVRSGNREFELNLYQGNAFLIFISEFNEDGEDRYSMYTFFGDKEHAKNCLGLNKKKGFGENIFSDGVELVKVRINKAKYSYTKELIDLLIKAFDRIAIEIYSEE